MVLCGSGRYVQRSVLVSAGKEADHGTSSSQVILPRTLTRILPNRTFTFWHKRSTLALTSSSPSCSTTLMDSLNGSREFERQVRVSGPARGKLVLIIGVDIGIDVPIIPGIMPIQNYASFRRLTNLCKCPVPEHVLSDLDSIKVSGCTMSLQGIRVLI